jgi:hypothetical protein
MNFLMADVYDYLFENQQNIGTNFCEEFPASDIDEENGVIYLAKIAGQPIYKIIIKKV